MRQISKLVLIGSLTVLVGGCQFFPGGGEDTVSEEVEAVPIPDDPVADGELPPGDEQAEEPVTDGVAVPPPPPADADLIASTNADERIRQITQERDNPFALIPATPRIISTGREEEEEQQAAAPPTRSDPSDNGTTAPGGLAPIPELVPQRPAGPPPPPPTDLARAVVVTGVVQIGTTVHAIVAAPNEPHSRYVREGQLLSNGQVLVKRIEFVPGGEPRVILEQNGVEITRAVGEGGLPSETTTASANNVLPPVSVDSSI
ncbi:MAG: hypothetical protein EA367_15615 [Leptolyngbya sp. DLM2.Bin15]|nr:MAG: hypothetical protein EA367_15615 [Leptolyngbya sp. DLM2.Bin15]